jgi:hypothetical protein
MFHSGQLKLINAYTQKPTKFLSHRQGANSMMNATLVKPYCQHQYLLRFDPLNHQYLLSFDLAVGIHARAGEAKPLANDIELP